MRRMQMTGRVPRLALAFFTCAFALGGCSASGYRVYESGETVRLAVLTVAVPDGYVAIAQGREGDVSPGVTRSVELLRQDNLGVALLVFDEYESAARADVALDQLVEIEDLVPMDASEVESHLGSGWTVWVPDPSVDRPAGFALAAKAIRYSGDDAVVVDVLTALDQEFKDTPPLGVMLLFTEPR